MARWADYPSAEEASALSEAFDALLRATPQGWSVVRGDRELVLRPPQRHVGKFSITAHTMDTQVVVRVAFFSQRRGHWAGQANIGNESDVAGSIMTWAEERLTFELGP